jgi:membrane protease YdiL (CAAX protease family)
MFAPWIASLFLRWLDRVPKLPRPLGLNRNWRYYLLSVAVPVVAVILAIPVYPLFGAGSFTWAGDNPYQVLLSLIPITLLASLTALGEEFGWRGFLLPLLLPLGKGKASLIVGAVWGAWHLPILLSGFTYPGQPVLMAVAVFMPGVILISFWFTELFIRSGESVALAALAHGTLNALSEISSPRHFPGLNPMFANPFGPTIGVIVSILMLFLNRLLKVEILQKPAASCPTYPLDHTIRSDSENYPSDGEHIRKQI